MLRSTKFFTLLGATALISAARVGAQTDTRPILVVFTFTNSALANRADFEGIATGVQDLLITDLAANSKYRLVDRSRIAELLQEQNLVKSGTIDPQTAVRLGRILGAQYAITGAFIADKSDAYLTSRTIDVETSEIANPEKIKGKPDDVLNMIAQLSAKISADMKLAPRRPATGGSSGAPGSTGSASSGGTSTSGSAGSGAAPGGSASSAPTGGTKTGASKTGATQPPSATNPARPANSETFAKQLPAPVVEKTMKTKLDAATMKVYSRALDEMDAKNNAKAAELLRQVTAKYPDFEPAQRNLDKLASHGN